MIRLSDLIGHTEGAEVTVGDDTVEIKHVEYDSRLVQPGTLFFAVKGFRVDGHDFVPEAAEKGAVAVMGERDACDGAEVYVRVPNARRAMADISAAFYGFPGLHIKACGVTGTNGKTTTCFILKRILEARDKRTGLITSQLYDAGKEQFAAERTTPESLDIQRLLFLMRKNNCVNAVIEVSSHALMLNRVDNINFRVAVYTNITRDHLDFHGDMQSYLAAKAKLKERIEGELSYVVINLDVPEFREFFGDIKSSYMTYSVADTAADVYCSSYEIRADGTTFDLVTPMGLRTVALPLPGRFNLVNALAAATAGLASGVDLDNVVAGLESATPVPGRFTRIDAGQPFAVYVDYAHTPDAIERLCTTAKEVCEGRLLLLFGCGGDRDSGKRPLMGTAATTNADVVMVTSDNPRGEEPAAIIEDIKPGLKGDSWEINADRREAIVGLIKRAVAGDVVLLAGKGAEPYQEIDGKRYAFSDADVAREALAAMGFAVQESAERN